MVSATTYRTWQLLGLVPMALLSAHVAAHAACVKDGTEYPDGQALEQPGGLVLTCEGAAWTLNNAVTPYEIKKAQLKSFEDPSQRPRCNAKESVQSLCGTGKLCMFKVQADLCANAEIAEATTHIEIVWRCRTDANWHFQRIERGENIILDCRK